MAGPKTEREKKFVESMLAKMDKKTSTQAYSATDVDVKEVEENLEKIRRKIQRGE